MIYILNTHVWGGIMDTLKSSWKQNWGIWNMVLEKKRKDQLERKSVQPRCQTNQTKAFLLDIQRIKLMYYGHIKRKTTSWFQHVKANLMAKDFPRHNWFVDVKKWTKPSAYESTSMAADRYLWYVVSRQPSRMRWHFQVIQETIWSAPC